MPRELPVTRTALPVKSRRSCIGVTRPGWPDSQPLWSVPKLGLVRLRTFETRIGWLGGDLRTSQKRLGQLAKRSLRPSGSLAECFACSNTVQLIAVAGE